MQLDMSNKVINGPLAAAAAAFEEELGRYASLANALRTNPMGTQKTLARGKASLQESVECEQRMSERIAALANAMNAAREEQLRLATDTLESAKRVQARANGLNEWMDRFAALGEKVRAVQVPLAEALSDAEAEAGATQVLSRLHDVTASMEAIIDEAGAMAQGAEADDWVDVARDATSMRQQVQAARNKALLVLRKLVPGPVS